MATAGGNAFLQYTNFLLSQAIFIYFIIFERIVNPHTDMANIKNSAAQSQGRRVLRPRDRNQQAHTPAPPPKENTPEPSAPPAEVKRYPNKYFYIEGRAPGKEPILNVCPEHNQVSENTEDAENGEDSELPKRARPIYVNRYIFHPEKWKNVSTTRPWFISTDASWPPKTLEDVLGVTERNKMSGAICLGNECSKKPKCRHRDRASCKDHELSKWLLSTDDWEPKFELRDAPRFGTGVFALQDIKRWAFLGAYMGELLPLVRESGGQEIGGPYAMQMKMKKPEPSNKTPIVDIPKGPDFPVLIDGEHYGNWTRYLNHSCDANTKFESFRVGSIRIMAVRATKDIKAGTEITADYTGTYFEYLKCLCGLETCRFKNNYNPQKKENAQEPESAEPTHSTQPSPEAGGPGEGENPGTSTGGEPTPPIQEVPEATGSGRDGSGSEHTPTVEPSPTPEEQIEERLEGRSEQPSLTGEPEQSDSEEHQSTTAQESHGIPPHTGSDPIEPQEAQNHQPDQMDIDTPHAIETGTQHLPAPEQASQQRPQRFATLKQRIAKLMNTNENLVQENNNLKMKVQELEYIGPVISKENNGLKSRVAELEYNDGKLNEENDALKKRVAELEHNDGKLSEENDAFKKRVAELEQNDKTSAENDTLRKRVADLEQNLTAIGQRAIAIGQHATAIRQEAARIQEIAANAVPAGQSATAPAPVTAPVGQSAAQSATATGTATAPAPAPTPAPPPTTAPTQQDPSPEAPTTQSSSKRPRSDDADDDDGQPATKKNNTAADKPAKTAPKKSKKQTKKK